MLSPSLAPPGTGSKLSASDQCALCAYQVPETDKKLIQQAMTPKDIPVKTRNRFYMAIHRMCERPGIDARIQARWAADSGTNLEKFRFLKEWAQDPSCATMLHRETHTRSLSHIDEKLYCWITKFDLYKRFGVTTNAPDDDPSKEAAEALLTTFGRQDNRSLFHIHRHIA